MKKILFGTISFAFTVILLGGLNNSSYEAQDAQKVAKSSTENIVQYMHGDAW
ncbi:hypothetical protein [Bacillus sp. C1]